MKVKHLFLILNVLLAVLVAFPITFAPSDGGSGGDGDGGLDGGDGPDSEPSETASESDVGEATDNAVGAATAGVDSETAGAVGEAVSEAMSQAAAGGVTATASTPGSVSVSVSVSTPHGTVSVSVSVSVSYTGTGVAGVAASVSISAKDLEGGAVTGENNPDGTYSDLGTALADQEKQNAENAKDSFWSGLLTVFGFIIGLVCAVCGLIATAVTVTTTVHSMIAENKNLADVVNDKLNNIAVAINTLRNVVVDKPKTAVQSAYAEVHSPKAKAAKAEMSKTIAEKNLPSESKSSGFTVAKIDPEDTNFPKYCGNVLC